MDQVLIKDLLARGIIGISDCERERAQDILINAVIYTDTRQAAQRDSIEGCVDYSRLARKLIAHAERAARYTVEALAEDLAKICLEEPGARGVRICVEKPGAVRFARSVGVEIERFRDR